MIEANQCRLFFLPPASSILNPIETVWAHLKRQWRQSLVLTNPEIMGENWMKRQLLEICQNFTEAQLENLNRAHYSDAIQVLEEAAQFYEADVVQPNQGWRI